MRSDAFVAHMTSKNVHVHVFNDAQFDPRANYHAREIDGTIREHELCRWLNSLPKPVAIMTCNDVRGQQLIDACQQTNIRVPDQVAVVGVDNDEIVCDFSQPSLSSVELNLKGIGFRAATALNRLMSGQAEPQLITVEPLGVVTRLSSDMLAVDDPIVAQAVALIREHAYQGINVEQMLDRLPISRATLERRFAKHFNRSPKEEIMRVRFSCAAKLLRDTDYNLTQVAEMSGCKTAAHLSVVFKTRVGIAPGEYRQRSRQGLPLPSDT
jgi:LacI family transcriptional regulator